MDDFDVVQGPSGQAADPLNQLLAEIDAAKADVKQVTIADVAAAAFVALETLVNLLPKDTAAQVIDAFEQRAAAFAASLEAGE